MKQLLFIRYKKSHNIFEGGEQASQKNLIMLTQALGYENVTVYYVHDETKKRSAFEYLSGGWWTLFAYSFGLSPKKVRQIVLQAQGYDFVWIDRSIFGIIAKKLKRSGYKGKILCFFHNVEVPYFSAKIQKFMPHRPFILHCANKNDRYTCRYADKIIVLNSRDGKDIEQRYQRKIDETIPITFADKLSANYTKSHELTAQKPVCLFLGSYFRPNNEGIKWFLKNVYPHVNIQMQIVGKGMSQLAKDVVLSENVEIHSDVPDLLSYFEKADLMILPIFEGSGMKVKTCESLMYGKNILGTTEAFEGYEVDYNQVGGLCNSAEEFIDKINDFSRNRHPRFNEYSRRIFLEKYSDKAVEKKFEHLLDFD